MEPQRHIEPTPDVREQLRQALKTTGRMYFPAQALIDTFADEDLAEVHRSIAQWSMFVNTYYEENKGSSSTKGLFRYYMYELGLTAPNDFTEGILDGDIIEVYKATGTRIFFNPELFDYSSYNPEDMFSTKWWHLYGREQHITDQLMQISRSVFSLEHKTPFNPKIPKHVVWELQSSKQYASEIELKSVSPIYMGGSVVAVAVREKFKLL